MEHCSGVLLEMLRASLSAVEREKIDVQLAALLRSMNSLTNPTFGRPAPSAPRFDSWSEAFVQLVDDGLHDGEARNVQLPCLYDSVRKFVRAQTKVLDEVTSPRLIHWDLWDANVFIEPDNLNVVGLIDFERALWADPLMEAQFLSKFDDEAFRRAYVEPVWSSPGARQRRLLYDLYLYVIMVVEVAYRQYPSDDIDREGRHQLGLTLKKLGIA